MTEPDDDELSEIKSERDYALHCLDLANVTIQALEAALREIISECAEGNEFDRLIMKIARAALDEDEAE